MSLATGKLAAEARFRGVFSKRSMIIGCEGSGKPAVHAMQDEDGNDHFIFFDDDGFMRISTDTIPDADTDGVALPMLKKLDITYETSSPATVYSLVDGDIVLDVWVEITTTWDGTGAALDVGDEDDDNGFMASAKITDTSTGYYSENADDKGDYLWDDSNDHRITKIYAAAKTLRVAITPGSGASQGAATIYALIQRLKG